jgi:site-specific DNA recombinase
VSSKRPTACRTDRQRKMSTMRAAIYARFSSDLQRETSIDDQVAVARRYAQAHGWVVLDQHVYTDAAISGASLDRPGVRALRAAVNSRPTPFDVLLVDDSSRIARDLADAVRFLQELRFHGIRVIYISQHIDSVSEQAETLIAVHGVVDSLYLRELSKKTQRGIAGQYERGFATGSRTFGYRTVPVIDPSGKKDTHGQPARLGMRVEIEPTEARTVIDIFTWYGSGLGIMSIVERLRVVGVAGPRGNEWKFCAVRRNMENERYLGRAIWGQRVFERRPGTGQHTTRHRPRSEWHVREVPELRIVSDDLWRQVAQRRAQFRELLPLRPDGTRGLMRGRHGVLQSPHLFVGFLKCGICGGAITVVYGRRGMVRYGCSRSHKNGIAACDNRLTVRKQVVDAHLLEVLRRELLRPETVRYISGELTRALNRVLDERPQRESELRKAREQAARGLQRLIAAIERGVDPSSLAATIRERQGELARLDGQIAECANPLRERPAVIPSWVENQLQDLASVLGESPERAKLEFQRLDLRIVMQPMRDEKRRGRPGFYRAVGEAALPCLAGTSDLTGQTVDRFRPGSGR